LTLFPKEIQNKLRTGLEKAFEPTSSSELI